MSRDDHFLSRLDRLCDAHVALALQLFRHPQIVLGVMSRAGISADVPRVALALDERPLGPRIIVTRDAHFVTCLAEGMANGPWPIVSRAHLDAERAPPAPAPIAQPHNNAPVRADWAALVSDLSFVGHRLSRESLVERLPIAQFAPDLLVNEMSRSAHAWLSNVVTLAARPAEARAPREVMIDLWSAGWALLHCTSILAMAPDALARRFEQSAQPGSTIDAVAVMQSLSSASAIGSFAAIARVTNLLARIGRPLLPAARKAFESRALPSSTSLCLALALSAMALSSAQHRAEALRTLLLDPETAAKIESRSIAGLSREDMIRYIVGRRTIERLEQRKPFDLREQLRRCFDGPADLARPSPWRALEDELALPITASLDVDINDSAWLIVACELGSHWGHASPLELYAPQRCLSALSPVAFDPERALRWSRGAVAYARAVARSRAAPSANRGCPCGSHRRFKHCCALTANASVAA